MKRFFAFFVLFSICFSVFSQNITARLIDKSTKKPIPFAAIKTAEYSGVISNDEGYFTLIEASVDSTITISCLGYENTILSIPEIKALNFIIPLEESINELNTVYVSNKKPNADSIIARARRNLAVNYEDRLYQHGLFSRETFYFDFKNLDFDVEKSSHVKKKDLAAANYSLDSLAKAIVNSKTIHFKDFKADLLVSDSLKTKMVVHKATELLDQKNSLSIEDVQKRAQNVMLKYLDTTLTYKLKTGLFKIEDSLSLTEEKQKDKTKKNEYEVNSLKNNAHSLLQDTYFEGNSMVTKFLDPDLYSYSFVDVSVYNNELIYIIRYTPKRSRAKYTGTLFITDDTYAVTKVDFGFAEGKRGDKFNLKLILGVKYVENKRKGTVIYQKDANNIYHPHYVKLEEGRYFYVSRPLKFIENSPQQNKTSFDFTIEGNMITKHELLLTSSTKIPLETYKTLKQEKTVPYVKLSKYDATIWDREQTLEPLEEMKQFDSGD